MMVDQIAYKSKTGGFPWSRLPVMSEEEKEFIKGSADFLAINHYSSRLVYPREENPNLPISWSADTNIDETVNPTWKRAKSAWLYSVPEGLRDLLVWIKNSYNNPITIIGENGWSDNGQIEDNDRIEYLKAYLSSVALAINEDKCNVVGYIVWSLTDNFEWQKGFTERFGIYSIDFQSVDKERVPKKSAQFFKDMILSKSFEL